MSANPDWEGATSDFHGYVSHDFKVNDYPAHVVSPKVAIDGNPWVWRTVYWDAFPKIDIALLGLGYHVGIVDVGNSYDRVEEMMPHFDAFYGLLTERRGLSKKPVLEGLSMGGMYAFRWAYRNADKVGCFYGDAALCDLKSWPGGRENPTDILAPLAREHVPMIHVIGEADPAVPMNDNGLMVRERYMKLGGEFVLISKQGCEHHPHGLSNPTPVVNYILAHTAGGEIARKARQAAPAGGSTTSLTRAQWSD